MDSSSDPDYNEWLLNSSRNKLPYRPLEQMWQLPPNDILRQAEEAAFYDTMQRDESMQSTNYAVQHPPPAMTKSIQQHTGMIPSENPSMTTIPDPYRDFQLQHKQQEREQWHQQHLQQRQSQLQHDKADQQQQLQFQWAQQQLMRPNDEDAEELSTHHCDEYSTGSPFEQEPHDPEAYNMNEWAGNADFQQQNPPSDAASDEWQHDEHTEGYMDEMNQPYDHYDNDVAQYDVNVINDDAEDEVYNNQDVPVVAQEPHHLASSGNGRKSAKKLSHAQKIHKTINGTARIGKKSKDDDRVKRLPNPFFIFAAVRRGELKALNPNVANWDISKWLGEEWKAMSDEDKSPYVKEFERRNKLHKKEYPHYEYNPNGKKKKVEKKKETVQQGIQLGLPQNFAPIRPATGVNWLGFKAI